jgi:DNA-binding response OmpR family regulator
VSCASPLDEPAPACATILLVEDEVLVRALVADRLRAQGYTVVEAANADEAVAVLGSVRVGLVLTDIEMPGTLDGVGLARLVRTNHPEVKVILGSGRAIDGRAHASADDFAAKPYDFDRLLRRIATLLAVEQ